MRSEELRTHTQKKGLGKCTSLKVISSIEDIDLKFQNTVNPESSLQLPSAQLSILKEF